MSFASLGVDILEDPYCVRPPLPGISRHLIGWRISEVFHDKKAKTIKKRKILHKKKKNLHFGV